MDIKMVYKIDMRCCECDQEALALLTYEKTIYIVHAPCYACSSPHPAKILANFYHVEPMAEKFGPKDLSEKLGEEYLSFHQPVTLTLFVETEEGYREEKTGVIGDFPEIIPAIESYNA